MKRISILFYLLISIWNVYSQDIPFDVLLNNKETNFLQYDQKRLDKEYKIKELIKAIDQCDSSFLLNPLISVYKEHNLDWLVQQGYDTLISVVDVNNDNNYDLVFSYCYACDEQLTAIFLNNGNLYQLSFEGRGCLSKIEFKNNILSRLTTFPCRCCLNTYQIFDDYILKDSATFSFSHAEYSIIELNVPEKFNKPIELLTSDIKCIFPSSDYKKPKDIKLEELDSLGNKIKTTIMHFEDCFEEIPSGTKLKILGSKNHSRFIIWEKSKDKYILGWIK
jgi:hypothetical protein